MKFTFFNRKRKPDLVSKETQTTNDISNLLNKRIQTDPLEIERKQMECQTDSKFSIHSDQRSNLNVSEKKSSLALDPVSSSDGSAISHQGKPKLALYLQDSNGFQSVFDHCEELIKRNSSAAENEDDDDDNKPLITDPALLSPMSSFSHTSEHFKRSPVQQLRKTELQRSVSARQASPKLINKISSKERTSQLNRTNSVQQTQRKFANSLNRHPPRIASPTRHTEAYLTKEKNDFINNWARTANFD